MVYIRICYQVWARYSDVGMNADNGASLHTIPVTLSVLKEYSEFYSINVYMILLVRK